MFCSVETNVTFINVYYFTIYLDIEILSYLSHFPILFSLIVLHCSIAQACPNSLQPHGLQPTRLLFTWNFPGKNTSVGCHFLLQGIFLTQGSNLSLLHLLYQQAGLYCWATWDVLFILFPRFIFIEHRFYCQTSELSPVIFYHFNIQSFLFHSVGNLS